MSSRSIAESPLAQHGGTSLADPELSGLGSEGWDYVGAITDYLTHDIHRYSSKFIPQIARRCIETLSAPGDLVLDPFCGSGTTLLEAALTQRESFGIDINPLACLLSRVKTTPIPAKLLEGEMSTHLGRIRESVALSRQGQLALSPGLTLPEFQHPYATELRKWFQPPILKELWIIYSEIRRIDARAVRDLCLVSFSDVLRRLSNAHSGYPNVMFDRNAPAKANAMEAYLRRVDSNRAAIERLGAFAGISLHSPKVVEAAAGALPLATSSVDLVVTHPPYIASVPYAEYLVLSLMWLAINPRQLDARLLGGRRNRQDVTERFAVGMAQAFTEMRRVLKSGASAVVVIGNPVVRGAVIDLRQSFEEIARSCGLSLVESITREKTNMRANKMRQEYVLVFRRV